MLYWYSAYPLLGIACRIFWGLMQASLVSLLISSNDHQFLSCEELLLYDSNLASSNSIKFRNSTGLHFAGPDWLLICSSNYASFAAIWLIKNKEKGMLRDPFGLWEKKRGKNIIDETSCMFRIFFVGSFLFSHCEEKNL